MVSSLKKEVDSLLDPFQFAYKQGRGTDDAINSVTHLVTKHLEDPKAYGYCLSILAQRLTCCSHIY